MAITYKVYRLQLRGKVYEAMLDILNNGVTVCSNVIIDFGSASPTDDEILSKCESFVTAQDDPQGNEQNDNQLSDVDTSLISRKEILKWKAVDYIRNTQSGTAETFFSTLSPEDAGIAKTLIFIYANNAARSGLITLSTGDIDDCYGALSLLVNNATDAQLREML